MNPIRKIPKKVTKKFVNKVINRQYFHILLRVLPQYPKFLAAAGHS